MTPSAMSPRDRAAFDDALAKVRGDHATLRSLAVAAFRDSHYGADATMSLAAAMMSHENAEVQLFDLPFVSRPPDSVISTAKRARLRCEEYTSGTYRLPDAHAAAGLFVDALLLHLAVEDAWLAKEDEHQRERLRTIA
ncbi:MAG TPA: hypothetical protein VMC81_04350 [Rhodocyclaceae bacterium]|nr:hypothetical protein [Rhodocyclaceae bacterium]